MVCPLLHLYHLGDKEKQLPLSQRHKESIPRPFPYGWHRSLACFEYVGARALLLRVIRAVRARPTPARARHGAYHRVFTKARAMTPALQCLTAVHAKRLELTCS